mmetsp:Transcript_36675/g.82483  ORF Transcript_36675/g.82483 Transcript_36675/m.82483 type:complete len:249 (-) Transcript_36675:10-756(-)
MTDAAFCSSALSCDHALPFDGGSSASPHHAASSYPRVSYASRTSGGRSAQSDTSYAAICAALSSPSAAVSGSAGAAASTGAGSTSAPASTSAGAEAGPTLISGAATGAGATATGTGSSVPAAPGWSGAKCSPAGVASHPASSNPSTVSQNRSPKVRSSHSLSSAGTVPPASQVSPSYPSADRFSAYSGSSSSHALPDPSASSSPASSPAPPSHDSRLYPSIPAANLCPSLSSSHPVPDDSGSSPPLHQ